MRIKNITVKGHKILGDMDLNFCDDKGNVLDTVIFVGENGSGKSTLLNIIYEFANLDQQKLCKEYRLLEVEFTMPELCFIHNVKAENADTYKTSYFIENLPASPEGDPVKMYYKDNTGNKISLDPSSFYAISKAIFSDTVVNFEDTEAEGNTRLELDKLKMSKKIHPERMSRYVVELLHSIQRQDAEDFLQAYESNNEEIISHQLENKRINRFKGAINSFFEDLNFTKIKDKIFFEKDAKEFEIKDLSTGEKQIVFRGSYILADKNSLKNALVLIEEPELGLHPLWQKKILQFYENIFKNENGDQDSQIFITTHSPYVIQECNLVKGGIYIFPKGEKVSGVRKYIGDTPSLGIINYRAYNLESIELHDELYGYIQEKLTNMNEKYDEPKIFDKYLHDHIDKKYYTDWQKEKNGKKNGTPFGVTLATFIRHKVHHPENVSMRDTAINPDLIKKSIDSMIRLIEEEAL